MRKSFFRVAAAFALAANLLVTTAFAEQAVVSGNDVNLRSGPGLNYAIIDCLSKGTALTVTDRSDGTWYAVDYNGTIGYMSRNYLKIDEDSTAPSSEYVANYGTGYINAMYVRFRSGPSSDSSILGEYNKGKSLTIKGTTGEWSVVIIDGQSGYVFSQYVSVGSAPAEPEAPAQPEANYEDTGSSETVFGDNVYFGDAPSYTYTPAPTAAPVNEPEHTDENTVGVNGEAGDINPSETPEALPENTEAPVENAPAEPTKRLGYINGDDVRFRTGPSTGYTIITSYDKGKELTINGSEGDWSAVSIDGRDGYVFSQYVKEGTYGTPAPEQAPTEYAPEQTPEYQPPEYQAPAENSREGYITGNNVRFRTEPSMAAGIITELYFGNSLTITGTSGDWTAVIIDGRAGYVYSQYVAEGTYNIVTPEQPAQQPEEPTVSEGEGGGANYGSGSGYDIASFACRFVGYNYTWGGKSPDTGFDCSGLVYYTYSQFGITLNRTAQDQAANGYHVDAWDLRPGDILCFYSGSDYIGHSGIYIGDNKFVHAANSSTGVIISELSGYYSTRGFEARRIVD